MVLFFNDRIFKETKFKHWLCTEDLTVNNVFHSLCCILLGFQILLTNICLRTFFDILFTLFLMLVMKSELYDIISCTSLGIVPVHYTFMYMDEREDNSRLVKTRILLISVYDVKQMLSIRLPLYCSHHKHKQSAHVYTIKLRLQCTMPY